MSNIKHPSSRQGLIPLAAHWPEAVSDLVTMNLPGLVEQQILGKGTDGKVYKAQRLTDGVSSAMKVVNLSTLRPREIENPSTRFGSWRHARCHFSSDSTRHSATARACAL
jgi:hypothetical protein